MVNINLTKEELFAIEVLVTENRDSSTLQDATNMSYLESIKFLNKIRSKK